MKRARLAAVNRVSSQLNCPEPSKTLTICARSIIKSAERGRDQKMINRAVTAICFLNASILFSLKRRERVGKAASEYETPIRERGADCRFADRDNIEME